MCGEIILKIGPHLPKLLSNIKWLFFGGGGHSVHSARAYYVRIWPERLLYDAEHDLFATAKLLVLVSFFWRRKEWCWQEAHVWHWIFRCYRTQGHSRSFEIIPLSGLCVFYCNCMYLVPFLRYSASKNGVTLKSWLGVVRGHWRNGTFRKLGYGFLFAFHGSCGCFVSFPR